MCSSATHQWLRHDGCPVQAPRVWKRHQRRNCRNIAADYRPSSAGTLQPLRILAAMGDDRNLREGLGVPPAMLEPGLAVMVPVGTISAAVNGGPSIVAYATVIGRASEHDAAVMADPSEMWWLDVHMGPGITLPQMYRADQILGVPALGLTMPGLPPATVRLVQA